MIDQLGEADLLSPNGRIGCRPTCIGIALDQSGIDWIALGQHSLRAAEVLNPSWIGDGNWEPCLLQGQAHREMIGSSGFTDHVDGSSLFSDLCDELAVALF